MDIQFTEEQELLRSSVQRLLRDQYDFEARRKIVTSEEGFGRKAGRQGKSLPSRETLKARTARENHHAVPDEFYRRLLREAFGLDDHELGFVEVALDVQATAIEELRIRLVTDPAPDQNLLAALVSQTDAVRRQDRQIRSRPAARADARARRKCRAAPCEHCHGLSASSTLRMCWPTRRHLPRGRPRILGRPIKRGASSTLPRPPPVSRRTVSCTRLRDWSRPTSLSISDLRAAPRTWRRAHGHPITAR